MHTDFALLVNLQHTLIIYDLLALDTGPSYITAHGGQVLYIC